MFFSRKGCSRPNCRRSSLCHYSSDIPAGLRYRDSFFFLTEIAVCFFLRVDLRLRTFLRTVFLVVAAVGADVAIFLTSLYWRGFCSDRRRCSSVEIDSNQHRNCNGSLTQMREIRTETGAGDLASFYGLTGREKSSVAVFEFLGLTADVEFVQPASLRTTSATLWTASMALSVLCGSTARQLIVS